jgi:hypothetical protein
MPWFARGRDLQFTRERLTVRLLHEAAHSRGTFAFNVVHSKRKIPSEYLQISYAGAELTVGIIIQKVTQSTKVDAKLSGHLVAAGSP